MNSHLIKQQRIHETEDERDRERLLNVLPVRKLSQGKEKALL